MSESKLKCDVIVIGGGPAGAISSALLSGKGYKTVLLEKQKHPRYIVGESILPHFWKYMDLMGIKDRIIQAGFINKSGGIVSWDNAVKGIFFKDFGYDTQFPGLHVERDEFDKILFDRSKELGTQAFENVKATSIKFGNGEYPVTVEYTDLESGSKSVYHAKYAIDCSGQNALTAKQYNFREFDPNLKFQSFWAYYDRTKLINRDGKFEEYEDRHKIRPTTIVSSTGGWGWVWNIVLKNTVSVGLVIPRESMSTFKKSGINLVDQFENTIRNTPIIGSTLLESKLIEPKIHSIKDYAYKPKQLTYENAFLAGDAAGFVDPINSAGVVSALYSGYVAQWAIDKSLQKPSRKDFYRDVYEKQYMVKLNLLKLLAYPNEIHDDEIIKYSENALKNQSAEEINLMISQLILINRPDNLIKNLKKLNIPVEIKFKDYDMKEMELI